ncbi:histidine kinase [Reichenbachiella sp. MALMAid0571]|uniref:sensor histidine kinase n=1 Tax=Reichenbachiella sp. MALMAid0571 TaxID=3143939 RepID=UPI0032DF5259
MKHPILEGSGYKLYALVWGIVGAVHAFVLYSYYDFSLIISFSDSLIHNALFGSMALGFWYVVRFSNVEKGDYISLITTHAVASVLTVVCWLVLSKLLLSLLFTGNEDYLEFLNQTGLWRAIIGVMYYSLIILTFFLVHYYLDLQEKTGKELQLKSLLNESELKMLKAQINPHFIFNSLNSISALTMTMPEKAREMVIKLSDFLRYSIGKESTEMNSLKEELQNVSLYLDIEKIRFGERLEFNIEANQSFLVVKVPNLILQPILENAVKYGVNESTDVVVINLSCELSGDLLHIVVSNNIDPESIARKGEGIGLENIRKRLSLIYGRTDLLLVDKKEDTFKVVVKVPVKPDIHEKN